MNLKPISLTKRAFDAQLQNHPELNMADSPEEQILAEISFGADCAANYLGLHHEARSYIHKAPFPVRYFEALNPDDLKALESSQIYIYKENGVMNANISIIYHF